MDSKVGQLHSRSESLIAEFKQGRETSCIDKAIILDREALELCPPGHSSRSVSLAWLASHLRNRYHQFGAIQDLEEAIVLDREALNLRPQGHPDRPLSLNNLALGLSTRHEQLGQIQDLNEAIVLDREALNLRQQGHPDRWTSLNNLAVDFAARFNRLGAVQDLDEAIVLHREVVDLCLQGHPDRSSSLNNLAADLSTRYNQLGEMRDLNEAIILEREALYLCPQGHPKRWLSLNNLAVDLSTCYKQLGSIQDLNEAIVLHRETLYLCLEGHPRQSMCLNNLAVDLSTRYNQLGAMQDLDEAIFLNRKALNLRPQGHLGRPLSLSNLAEALSTRYKQLGAIQDLDEAIVFAREALDLCPEGHPDRSLSFSNLAASLFTRHKQLGAMRDLDEAIVLNRKAIDLRPQRHPDRSTSVNNLAANLSVRFGQVGSMQDLDEAIVLNREALDLRPQGHPDWSMSVYNLARCLGRRFIHSKQLRDKEEAFSLYTQLTNVIHVVSSTDLSAARAWVHAAEHFQHSTLLLAYATSLRLLIQHLATLPSLPQHLVILKNLTSSLAVDAFSACLRNRFPTRAVELLEQGRGVFWNQLARLRSPLDEIVASDPAGEGLAKEFTRLVSLIRNAFGSPGVDQHERVFRYNVEMQRVVTNIRELPGLSRFLLPYLFSDLQLAASGGPIIIVSASQYGCDALVVLLDRDPVHIPLQITRGGVQELAVELRTLTTRATRDDMTRGFAFLLRRLWDHIVSPIVDFLETTHPFQSRIWWCPTAEFSLLPLHAAGPYRKGQRNLPNLYISSYTPTLTALIRARRHDQSNSLLQKKCFVAVGQAEAAGENELFSIDTELDKIGQCVEGFTTFTRIDGEESCISRVAKELGKNQWVHLACHGLPNPTHPFESAFALHDGHFTIQRIIGCDLQNPEFAYLSACHTTVGYEESPDEVIHLASAMQFAGFRSVIGTMWAVDDGETNKITSTFYGHMVNESGQLDHTRAAFALNKTMKSVRVPLDQRILYIHIGA